MGRGCADPVALLWAVPLHRGARELSAHAARGCWFLFFPFFFPFDYWQVMTAISKHRILSLICWSLQKSCIFFCSFFLLKCWLLMWICALWGSRLIRQECNLLPIRRALLLVFTQDQTHYFTQVKTASLRTLIGCLFNCGKVEMH